ncbi:uncharacterized protein LOC129578380 [Sitodiplosis mosellana]|uniref:uncharacterized protein LOC129578380 n=1 Tax=Sitodiplosis mosellana TaxID=263140 RepID=UPI002443919A|nr:uncharacterized protein LOC129578380 [Sitodiplosis mosellana]
MIAKILIVALLCVAYTLAEAPFKRYRYQRFRQAPSRQFFARQEAPYPESTGGEPAAEYGPPPTTTTPAPTYGPPPPAYGPPAAPGDVEPAEAPDTEVVAAPSRFTQFGDKLSLPATKGPQKFSQRLELQQQVKQFPSQQQVVNPFVAPVGAKPTQFDTRIAPTQFATPVAPTQFATPLQFRPVAELQATVTQPELYVNTVVQSQVSADE